MSTRQCKALERKLTVPAFFTTRLGTRVAAFCVYFGTCFITANTVVEGRCMALHGAVVSARELCLTRGVALGQLVPLFRELHRVDLRRVSRAAGAEVRTDFTFPSEGVDDLIPHFDSSHLGRIADNVKAVPCTTAAHIYTVGSLQKAHEAVLIASHEAKDDYL